jgi:hypothetical protein
VKTKHFSTTYKNSVAIVLAFFEATQSLTLETGSEKQRSMVKKCDSLLINDHYSKLMANIHKN